MEKKLKRLCDVYMLVFSHSFVDKFGNRTRVYVAHVPAGAKHE